MEKVCQLYKEEQVGKLRKGRKVVPSSKMPDLGWDIAETQLRTPGKPKEVQETTEMDILPIAISFWTMIAIAILITTKLEHGTRNARKSKKNSTNCKIYDHKNQPYQHHQEH